VSLARATEESVGFEVRVVGTVEPSSAVQVKSQVAGELMRVHFTEGQNVEKGALLFEIDSRPYREALRQAEAALARDMAQLRQAEAVLARDRAQAKNAESEAERYTQLMQAGVISRSQHDQARTSADVSRESARAAEASIESNRAAIQSDQAAIDKAKLDISYCAVHAPIAGRTGNLLLNAGNLVRANGDSPLVVIHQVTPIFVSFSVPEQHLATVRRIGAGGKLPVRIASQDQAERAATGHVTVIDNIVDRATGTIRLKATLNNADGFLWPGQFVNVTLALGAPRAATVVPAEALQVGQQGSFIYVVKSDGTVEPRIVTPGRSIERRVVIERGISPGETVVVDGQLRLFPGARVRSVDAGKLEGLTL
jgi:multidrug efflux system membrane fusion protein